MTPIYHLDQITPSERSLVGEKAFALSQLLHRGLPINTGFVVGVTCLEEFLTILRETEPLLLDWPVSSLHIEIDNYKMLQEVAQRIRHQILNTSFPNSWDKDFIAAIEELPSTHIILRPSLVLPSNFTLESTGILKSQICRGNSHSWSIALKQVWAQLFRARSLFYWQRMGVNLHQIRLAILVQPIHNAIASGIVEVTPENLHIKSNWGLGHSLVEGNVLPDYYEVQRFTGEVIKQKLGNKPLAYKVGENSLETSLLSPEEQENYSLNQDFLNLITALTKKLFPKENTLATLEWTIIDSPQSQVCLTQIDTYKFTAQTKHTQQKAESKPQTARPMLLKGISASPGQAIAKAYLLSGINQHLQSVPSARILVAKNITLDWLPLLQKAVGVITEEGGKNSHGAIIARELGIPAVVGVKDAIYKIQNDISLLINGDLGEVYDCSEIPSETIPTKPINIEFQQTNYPPIATKLLVNISQTTSIAKAINLPVDGLGLLRSESMIMELLSSHPLGWWLDPSRKLLFLEKLIQLITKFAQEFAPRPIFYRSLDRRALSEKHPDFVEKNNLFELEIQALVALYNSGDSNIKVILPFIRSVPEFAFYRDIITAAGLNNHPNFQLWIMAEVPSVLFLLKEYVEAGVQGIAIGSNDLTQFILGIDREDTKSEQLFAEAYPAVFKAIEQIIKQAIKLNIPCSICGQLPVNHPEIIEHLIRWGITSISVEHQSVESAYDAIARAERSLLLDLARQQLSQ